jgi:hypothetical protein
LYARRSRRCTGSGADSEPPAPVGVVDPGGAAFSWCRSSGFIRVKNVVVVVVVFGVLALGHIDNRL